MDTRATGDFSRFVAARWPELVRTAYLVCGDRERAVRTTTVVLAAIGARWRQVADEGAPAAESRTGLVRRLVRDDRSGGDGTAQAGPEPAAAAAAAAEGGTDSDAWAAVRAALLQGYAGLPVVARVALALEQVEGLSLEQSALALGRPVAEVVAATRGARGVLAGAHAAARSGHRLPPAEYAVEADLREALEARAGEVDTVGDPVRLVAAARASRRRRTGLAALGLGGVVALAAVGVGAHTMAGGGSSAGPSATAIASTDPRWADASTWPARGELANDLAIRRLIADDWGGRAQLLYAGDVGGTRMVVGWDSGRGDYAPRVDVIAGPSNRELTDVTSQSYPAVWAREAIVVLGIPTATSVPLLVLARPTTTSLETSTTVSYDERAGVVRSWSERLLTGGVAELALPALVDGGEAGYGSAEVPALRVRLDGFDGPPVNQSLPAQQMTPPECGDCSAELWAARTAEMAVGRISAATGLPTGQIGAEVRATGTVTADVGDDAVVRLLGTSADVSCILYRLPGGVALSSTAVRGRSGSTPSFSSGRLDVVPAAGAERRPCAQRVGLDRTGAALYVLAAPGTHALQLSPGPTAGTAGPVVPAPDAVAMLAAGLESDEGVLRTFDEHGQLVGSWPFFGLADPADAFDLGPTVGG